MSFGPRVVSRLPAGVRDGRWGATALIGEASDLVRRVLLGVIMLLLVFPLRRCRGWRVWRGHGDSVGMTTVATSSVVGVMGCDCSDSAIVVCNP